MKIIPTEPEKRCPLRCIGMPGRPWIANLPWVDQRSCEY